MIKAKDCARPLLMRVLEHCWKSILITLLVLTPLPPAHSVPLYRYTDADGRRVYSDRLAAAPIVLAKSRAAASLGIYITAPQDGSSIVSPAGSLRLSYRLTAPRPLQLHIRALVDQQPHPATMENNTLFFEALAPGRRQVQLQAFDGEGKLLGASEPAIFYLLYPPR